MVTQREDVIWKKSLKPTTLLWQTELEVGLWKHEKKKQHLLCKAVILKHENIVPDSSRSKSYTAGVELVKLHFGIAM